MNTQGMVMAEGLDSAWTYQESVEELKQVLLCTTMELESTRMLLKEEITKNQENVKQFLHHIKVTSQERDEFKEKFHVLADDLLLKTKSSEISYNNSINLQPETPPGRLKQHASLSESESLSENHKHPCYDSSPGDSFNFDPFSMSPEFQNLSRGGDQINNSVKMLDHQNSFTSPRIIPNDVDDVNLVMNNNNQNAEILRHSGRAIRVKSLPQRGKFLQAVLEAGPTLQTLMIAGPLPQWRNPPPLQTLQLPPLPGSEILIQKPVNSLYNNFHLQGFSQSCTSINDSYTTCPTLPAYAPLTNSASMTCKTTKRPFFPTGSSGCGVVDPFPMMKLQRLH